MSHTIQHKPKPAVLTGYLSLMPGVPRPLVTGGGITAFVDRDAVTADRTFRFELGFNGAVVSAFGLRAGFTSQPLACGWALTHYATTYDDNGAVSLVDVVIH